MLNFSSLLLGFVLNLSFTCLIVRFIYYPRKANKNYVFTYITFSTLIFFVMTLLSASELSLGVGLGLFALFSVLRYRTDTIPTRDMTYLFTCMALPLINALISSHQHWQLVLFADIAVVLVLFVLERGWGFRFEQSLRVNYERIDMIVPEKRGELLADLEQRSGFSIKRLEIGDMDFVRDSVEIKIFFDPEHNVSQG